MPDTSSQSDQPSPPLDPVYRHTRREAVLIVIVWAITLIWCVGYCHLHGYGRDGEAIRFVMGVPRWVFFGVLLPWIVAGVVSIVIALFVIRDDDLGEARIDRDD